MSHQLIISINVSHITIIDWQIWVIFALWYKFQVALGKNRIRASSLLKYVIEQGLCSFVLIQSTKNAQKTLFKILYKELLHFVNILMDFSLLALKVDNCELSDSPLLRNAFGDVGFLNKTYY